MYTSKVSFDRQPHILCCSFQKLSEHSLQWICFHKICKGSRFSPQTRPLWWLKVKICIHFYRSSRLFICVGSIIPRFFVVTVLSAISECSFSCLDLLAPVTTLSLSTPLITINIAANITFYTFTVFFWVILLLIIVKIEAWYIIIDT